MRWGFIGCGAIAANTAQVIRESGAGELYLAGSREPRKAEAFAAEHGFTGFGDYDRVIGDDRVDVVYVATPHPFHHPLAMAALQAGRGLLCEKPMALNTEQTCEIVACARARSLFLMEAVWSRFLPAWQEIQNRIGNGDIGAVRMVQADTGYRVPVWPEHRLFRPDLAGGGLLDIGVYGVSLATWLLGEPSSIQSTAHIGETGVDEQSAILLGYADGALAQITSGVRTRTINTCRIFGETGSIVAHANCNGSSAYDHINESGTVTTHSFAQAADRRHMVLEVARCVQGGQCESPSMTWQDSVDSARIMTTCRKQWGLCYPQEQ